MPYCVPPIVNSWSINGELPNTNPDRVERPMPHLTPPPVGRPPESGAYQRPSRSKRWKFPVPPSGPPLCERPTECIVPAVGNGRSIRVSRMTDRPMVERIQLLQLSDARPVVRSEEASCREREESVGGGVVGVRGR